MSTNIVKQDYQISRDDRNEKNKHKSVVLWFTGLSGSGKSTLANRVESHLFSKGISTYSLDGDNIRGGLNSDLNFTPEDRHENLRRIAEVAKLFVDSGVVVLAAFISPLKKDRKEIARIIGEKDFVEIYVNTSLETCEQRDVKGLYKKARSGEIDNFTGVSAPYEAPENPEVETHSDRESIEESTEKVISYLENKLKL